MTVVCIGIYNLFIKETEEENHMREIIRSDVNEEWAHSGIVEAGDFVFISYCVGNIGQPIENQINGAFDHLNQRLKSIGLTIESVVKIDCLFRDVWNIPVMEKVIKERFKGKYPARKSIQTEFAHSGGQDGLLFQLDAIAFKG
jgi:enamine deaminase RidA (YjgF/YER057c/UK114 family)